MYSIGRYIMYCLVLIALLAILCYCRTNKLITVVTDPLRMRWNKMRYHDMTSDNNMRWREIRRGDLTWYSMARNEMKWHDIIGRDMAQHGMTSHDMTLPNMACDQMKWQQHMRWNGITHDATRDEIRSEAWHGMRWNEVTWHDVTGHIKWNEMMWHHVT